MRNFPHCILALVLALTGCAAAGQRAYPPSDEARLAAYATARNCCADPAEMTFQQLPTAGSIDVVIGTGSPAFEFQSGLSHFAAFRLPDIGGAYRIRVKSLLDGPDGPGASTFYPVMAVMDDTFIVTRVSSLDNVRLEQSLATPGAETGFAVSAPFDPAAAPERYLVVFTPAVLIGSPPDERREGDVLTGPTLDWLNRRGPGLVGPSPYGRLSISVVPLTLPGTG